MRRPAAGTAGDRGGVALFVLMAGGLTAVVALVVIVAATDAAVAAAKARTAADAAALAAAAALPVVGGDGDARAAAEALAEANDAEVIACCRPELPGTARGAEAAGGADRAGAAGAESPGVRVRVVVTVRPRTTVLRSSTTSMRSAATAVARPAASPYPTGPTPRVPGGDGRSGSPDRSLRTPAIGPVTSGFGWRLHPITALPRRHSGVDFAAPRGAPVLAAADGVVTGAGWRGGYGRTVIVDHGEGRTTLYAHQSRIDVSAGQRVRQGERLGAVGSTGHSTGPHLHFEVRVGRRPVDPLDHLR